MKEELLLELKAIIGLLITDRTNVDKWIIELEKVSKLLKQEQFAKRIQDAYTNYYKK